jgi:hypothetical protein
MKKLSLDLDTLNVESFSTAPAERAGGTVRGYITLQCSDGCNTWDTACGGGSETCTCTKDQTCNCPTVIGYSCEFDTCDLPDCTGPATCEGC